MVCSCALFPFAVRVIGFGKMGVVWLNLEVDRASVRILYFKIKNTKLFGDEIFARNLGELSYGINFCIFLACVVK